MTAVAEDVVAVVVVVDDVTTHVSAKRSKVISEVAKYTTSTTSWSTLT